MTAPRRLAARKAGALLESVVALTVLSIVGLAAASLSADSTRAVTRALDREHQVREASQLLTAVSLWPREDLDRHLGKSTQGWMRLGIDRTTSTVYAVTVLERSSGRELLSTKLYRPATSP
jgi:type II secretory pathway pseudopilin PulG